MFGGNLHIAKNLIHWILGMGERLITSLSLVIFVCSLIACSSDDLAVVEEQVAPSGIKSGNELKIADISSSSVADAETRYFKTKTDIDSFIVLLSNSKVSSYNYPNHAREYRKKVSTPVGSSTSITEYLPKDTALYLGEAKGIVMAYAPDTVPLISKSGNEIKVYCDSILKKPKGVDYQTDYIFASTNSKKINALFFSYAQKSRVYDPKKPAGQDSASFTMTEADLTFNHALSKVEIYVCNLAVKDTAKSKDGSVYTTYTGVGNVTDVYLYSLNKQFRVQGDFNVETGAYNNVVKANKIRWGTFSTAANGMQNITVKTNSTPPSSMITDTAYYNALVIPTEHSKLSVGVTIDGATREVALPYLGTATSFKMEMGANYKFFLTICDSKAEKFLVHQISVIEWREELSAETLNDKATYTYDAFGNLIYNEPVLPSL